MQQRLHSAPRWLPGPGARDLQQEWRARCCSTRSSPASAWIQEARRRHYGVTPDVATFGKAVAGGVPLSVIAGRKDVMELIVAGRGVSFGGTFNGNPISLAGAHAALEEISRDDGAALRHADKIGVQLMEGIRQIAAERGLKLLVSGFGAAFGLHFTGRTELRDYRDTLDDDASALQKYLQGMMEQGIHSLPDGRIYVSAAHGQQEVEETLGAIRRVLGASVEVTRQIKSAPRRVSAARLNGSSL